MTADDIVALARRHGLALREATVRVEEAGLDYRVAFAELASGEPWVLRIPRREDVRESIDAEAAILELVRPALSVAVPDWRVHTRELIAYPRLPGEPGLTIGEDGAPTFHLDVSSPTYARAFGALVAELHRVDVERARAAGVEIETPEDVRTRWRRDLETVRARFSIAAPLLARWTAWLDDDRAWPSHSLFTHGELYPAHILIDADDPITGVLDWTTAKVSDPARDFVFQHAMASPESFALTVDAYVDAGGRVWPGLVDHCAGLWSASPIAYGLFAMKTGDPEHLAAAAAQLDPAG